MKIHSSVLSVGKSSPEKLDWKFILKKPIIIFTDSGQNLCKWVVFRDSLDLICFKWNDICIFSQTILPQEWPYNVTSFSQNGSHYKIKLVLPSIGSADELRLWTDSFMRLSQCVYIRTASKKNRSSLTPHSVNLKIFSLINFLYNWGVIWWTNARKMFSI